MLIIRAPSGLGTVRVISMSHDFPEGIVEQDYLGVDKIYYDPVNRGYEAEIRKRLKERGIAG